MDLFHRHRSKYYALIRHWYSEGLLSTGKEEERKKASLSAKDSLVSYDYILPLALHEEKYCFSSLYEHFDPVLPFLFTTIEKRYLKTLLKNPLFQHWLGEEAMEHLNSYLLDTAAFPDFFQDMSQGGEKFPLPNPEMFLAMYESIIEKRMISFSYRGSYGNKYKKKDYFPYRLLLDKETGLWQILVFSKNQKKEFICNLERIRDFSLTEEWFSDDLQGYLNKNREERCLVLKLRPDKNSIERSFLLFHDYLSNPSYDKEKDRYTLSIPYYPKWEEEDLRSKVFSLGSAVEVLEPQEFRDKIIEEIKKY